MREGSASWAAKRTSPHDGLGSGARKRNDRAAGGGAPTGADAMTSRKSSTNQPRPPTESSDIMRSRNCPVSVSGLDTGKSASWNVFVLQPVLVPPYTAVPGGSGNPEKALSTSG